MTGAALLRANAIRLPFADDSVDLLVTSPPYFALRSYRDGGEHYEGQIGSEPTPLAFLEALWAVTEECKRVLKPSGSMFVNLGDKYAGSGGHNNSNISRRHTQPLQGGTKTLKANDDLVNEARQFTAGGGHERRAEQRTASRRNAPDAYNKATIGGARPKSLMGLPWRYANGCVDHLDLILRAEIIWDKPNALPESADDRVRRSHEQWFHFTKDGDYFAAIDEIREPHTGHRGNDDKQARSSNGGTNHRALARDESLFDLRGKLPGSVWRIPSEPLQVPDYLNVDHFAAFPQEWPRRFILGWSPSGICLKCSQGRRPVAEVATIEDRRGRVQGREGDSLAKAYGPDGRSGERYKSSVRITGEACACAGPDAPTRPAIILDPFVGTGTVPMVARALGRYGVGVDLSSDYLRLAHWRVFKSGHASKSRERTNLGLQGSML